MEIINNKLNSLPEQVEENMLNIQKLAEYYKDIYKTSLQMLDTDVTISISNTNATSDTTSGWLIDSRGLLFNITGGDGTNLLLDFYSDLKGPQGNTGATGATGADGTDGFSIRYTSEVLTNIIGNATTILKTSVTPIDNIVVGDLIIDSNGYLGKVFFIDTTTIDVRTIVCIAPRVIDDNTPSDDTTYSSNKIDSLISGLSNPIYIHNIRLVVASGCDCYFTIINHDSSSYNTLEKIRAYLYDNDLNLVHPLMASGEGNYNSQGTNIIAVSYNTYEGEARVNITEGYQVASQTEYHTRTREVRPSNNPTITDTIITL